MIRLTALHCLSVFLAVACQAEEITVESRPFSIERSFAATAFPDTGCVLLQVEPKSWTDFQIVELAQHGSKVAMGDTLVRFDPEAIDHKLVDLRRSLDAGTLALAQAALDFKHLLETRSHKLEAFRRAAEIAKEENSYFIKTRRKSAEDSAAQSLERKKQMLSNQQEELRQLTKMYAADDVTEETEEIILTRQKDAVVAAEFALRMETLDFKRTLDVALPREAVTLANNERDTAIHFHKAESEIPRLIETKIIEIDGLKTAHQRDQDALTELQADRAMFEIKAPAAGWFYHGPIENGRWTPSEALKTLFKHGRPPVNRPFATFVPASARMILLAFLDETTARSLTPGLVGTAVVAGREDLEIPVKLIQISAIPEPDGFYRASLSATWPQDFIPTSSASVRVHMLCYQQKAAIAIPTKMLSYDSRGWVVTVKLANGKTESRPVKRGRVAKNETEILSGLEVGQVMVAP